MTKPRQTRRGFMKSATAATLGACGLSHSASDAFAHSAEQPAHTGKTSAPTLYKTDVLVVGGGPAGIGAALAAARAGVKTLLIENHGFFGGVASFSIGMNVNQMRPQSKPRSDVHELLIEKLVAYGKPAVQVAGHALRCNVEYLKVAVLDALDQVGCKYLVHTRAVDAVVQGNRITGVVIATKRGPAVIEAGVVVDCTGDADITHYAGGETLFDKDNSPMTLCLNFTNISLDRASPMIRAALRKAHKSGKYPLIPKSCLLQRFTSEVAFNVNHHGTRVYGPLDATDPEQLTTAECFSRRQAVQMVQAIREFGPDDVKNIELICTGPQIGIRESRRLKGLYILTEDDAVKGRKFDDVVAWRSGAIDVGGGVYDASMKMLYVPYRAILPERVDSLLAAGRCISTTHIAHSAGKSMGNCLATGHAAGVAAALAVKEQCIPRNLNVGKIQAALEADRVDLNPT